MTKITQIIEQLSPDSTLEQLKMRKTKLESLISIKEQALKKAPSGKLRISKNKGTHQYYLENKKELKQRKYIPKTQINLVKALCQSDYNKKVLKVLKKQYEYISKIIFQFEKWELNNIFSNLCDARRIFVEPVTLPDAEYVKRWQIEKYTGKPFEEHSPEFYTSNGIRVRSKSEIIIAESLIKAGIPFRYEYPLKFKNFTVHPDFICLNIKNRTEFIWEHFGLMDDENYSANTVQKLLQYQKYGFFMGKNLIFTMETKQTPLNTTNIEELIMNYLA